MNKRLPTRLISAALTIGAGMLSPILHADAEWVLNKASFDETKLGPDGKASLMIEPGGSAVLKFSETDVSGNVSMAVFDDGAKPIPGKERGVGPRWGIASAEGRNLAAGIMYAPYLAEGGAICILDINPADSWFGGLTYYSGRSAEPKWQTWKFDFNADTGLKLLVNGKDVGDKKFNWDSSKINGMNSIAIFGDETGKPGAQTLWVGAIEYQAGPPMNAKPAGAPPPPIIVPDEDPAATKVWALKPELQDKHPRLLLTEAELPKLRAFYNSDDGKVYREKIEAYVGASSPPGHTKWLKDATDGQRQGFWRLPTVALHYLMTGDKNSLAKAKGFLEEFYAEPHWELGNELDSGMSAANIMVGAALAYDWIYNDLDPEFREKFGAKLLLQARAMYYGGHMMRNPGLHYWQGDPANNHRWHRNAGLTLSILAVYEGRPDQQWIMEKAIEDLQFVEEWLPNDGTSHEGPNYFTFGGNHLTVAFDAADIALGTEFMKSDYFKSAGQYRMGTLLPGLGQIFSYGDGGRGSLGTYNNFLFAAASANNQADIKDGLLTFQERHPDAFGFGWFSLLWDNPDLKRGDYHKLPTNTLWEDVGFASMRESWDDDAVAASFICGPFGGYDLLKFADISKKYVNVAHDDPDANEFQIAKGPTLMVETDGYSKHKASRNHNTILINGMGQMTRGRAEGGVWSQPGGNMTQMAYVTSWKVTDKITAIEGEAAGSYLDYTDKKTNKSRPAMDRYRRSFLWVKGDYILVLDDIRAPEDVEISWLIQGAEVNETNASEGRYAIAAEGKTLPMQLVSETEFTAKIQDSTADGHGKIIGLRQLNAQTTTSATRFASVYDAWEKGDVTVDLQTKDADHATVTVSGKGFKDVWTWDSAPDNETAATIKVERLEGDKTGLPFQIDDSSNSIAWKLTDAAH